MWPFSTDHAGALQADILDIADDACGEDRAVERCLHRAAVRRLDGGLHRPVADREAGHAGAGVKGHALRLERLGRGGRDVLVLDRQDARQKLHDRDGAAEVGIETRELHADGAGADHQQGCRLGARHHRLPVGPDHRAVGLQPRQHPRTRAGGEDDVGGTDGFGRSARLRDLKRAGAREPALALEHRHPVLLHQVLDAAGELIRHLARIGDDLLDIDRDVACADAEVAEAVEGVADFGDPQQRLGRDAAPVEADAAEALALDHGALEAELAGPDRRDIAAGAAADDDDVKGRIRHDVLRSPIGKGSGLYDRPRLVLRPGITHELNVPPAVMPGLVPGIHVFCL